MDPSHILVGGLTAVSIGLLVWIEIRSRRNAGVQKSVPSERPEVRTVPKKNRR